VANKSWGKSTEAPVINFLRSFELEWLADGIHFVEHLPYRSKAATVAFAFASAHDGLV